MHVRQQVLEAVKTVLATGTTWQRVFASRLSPDRDVLPYLLVAIESEGVEVMDIHPGHTQQRDLQLSVRGRVRVVEGEQLETSLADVQEEIETLLTSASLRAHLAGVRSLALLSVTSDIINDENERTYAEVALDWQVRIFTTEGNPSTLQ